MSQPHWILPSQALATYKAYLDTGNSGLAAARARPPQDIVSELEASGLRGRGGAGFPTGTKWRTVFEARGGERAVVCNAAEGEPGTFKDRMLLRRNPWAVIEGMLIAAHVLDCARVYLPLKASFSRAIKAIEAALAEMEQAGALGGVQVELVPGPEEYLFGEEKALLNFIENAEPLPREAHYPPYEWGLNATPSSPNPALVNNAETFARVSSIIAHGGSSFRTLGSAETPGPLLFTLSGAVQRPGVYEILSGTPMGRIFSEQGGGPRPDRHFVAALCGVSAAPLMPAHFDTPACFDALKEAGSGLGSAGFVLCDDQTDMARVTEGVLRFLYVESCSQCSACKAGLHEAWSNLDKLLDPERREDQDLERVLYGVSFAPQGNRCYLPEQAAQLIPSLVESFPQAFEQDAVPGSWQLPKLVGYDPEQHAFHLDPIQQYKQPDWSYDFPSEVAEKIEMGATVQLEPGLDKELQQLADHNGLSLDEQVCQMLRDWMARGLRLEDTAEEEG